MAVSFFILSLFALYTTVIVPTNASKYPILYLSDYSKGIGVTYRMTTGAGILYSQRSKYYNNYVLDAITIRTSPSKRIIFNFERLAVETDVYGGCDDRITIVDGPERGSGKILTPSNGLCGSSLPRTYYSSGNTMYIELYTNSVYRYTGFKLVFTSFVKCNTNGTSKPDMFKCDNNFCIESYLVEDDHNNCGDNSDEEGLTTGEIVGIVFGVLFGVLLLIFCVLMCIKEAKGRKKARIAMPANVSNTVPQVMTYATNQGNVYQPSGVAVPPQNYYSQPPPYTATAK